MNHSAGDSGEFYTPRPVVRFMVAVTDPRLGETVLDPACGTGGFLVESYTHLEQAKVDRLKALQTQSAAELDALLPSILDKAFKGEL